MKKTTLFLLITCLSLSFWPIKSIAVNSSTKVAAVASKSKEAAEAKTLLTRLDEINTITKTDLNPIEKKRLRKEVRSIRHRLNDLGNGIYISAGGLILILILLIILL